MDVNNNDGSTQNVIFTGCLLNWFMAKMLNEKSHVHSEYVCTNVCTVAFKILIDYCFPSASGGIRTHDRLLTSADVLI